MGNQLESNLGHDHRHYVVATGSLYCGTAACIAFFILLMIHLQSMRRCSQCTYSHNLYVTLLACLGPACSSGSLVLYDPMYHKSYNDSARGVVD